MNGELWAALIGAAVLLLTNLAGLVKVWADLARQKADRAATKAERDQDSMELHDKVLKMGFEITRLKDEQHFTSNVVNDLRDQCAALNTNIAKLDVNVANLTEAIKEMRRSND